MQDDRDRTIAAEDGTGAPDYLALDAVVATTQFNAGSGGIASVGNQVYPYGEQLSGAATKDFYTNQHRDPNGLDHFWMRTYSSNLGRWLTPDPGGLSVVDLKNPQSWNRYSYVQNNPVAAFDPVGMDMVAPGNNCVAYDSYYVWDDEAAGKRHWENEDEICSPDGSDEGVCLLDDGCPGGDGGGGGGGVGTSQTAQRKPAQCTNPDNAQEISFLQANYSAASPAAASLNIPVADILGLAAEESGSGENGATKYANNPLALTNAQVFPGSTGQSWTSRLGVKYPIYSSLAANYTSFANSRFGTAVADSSTPAAFANNLEYNAPPGHYSNDQEVSPDKYIQQLISAINDVTALLVCIGH